MPGTTYDTNVFIRERPAYFPAGFFMSAVVIQELAAGARDNSRLKELHAAQKRYEKEGRLLVPDEILIPRHTRHLRLEDVTFA